MNTEEITKYIFLEDTDQKGDLAFVFGTWDVWHESLQKAAQLYKTGLVPKVLVSSGVNPVTGVIEGDLMASDLEKLGVPKVDILIENKSTNTLENVLFSKDIIDNELGLKNIKTIVGIVKNYHARRALMTLRKHLPEDTELKTAAYVSDEYPFRKDNWHKTEGGARIVLEEVEKIKTYLAQGDLKEL